jgi:hypothetical protein
VPVPIVSGQQAAPMAGQHSPLQTRQSAQISTTHGNSSSDQATGGHQDAPDDGGYNNTELDDDGGRGSSSGPRTF